MLYNSTMKEWFLAISFLHSRQWHGGGFFFGGGGQNLSKNILFDDFFYFYKVEFLGNSNLVALTTSDPWVGFLKFRWLDIWEFAWSQGSKFAYAKCYIIIIINGPYII
jgi:hypothetical protein